MEKINFDVRFIESKNGPRYLMSFVAKDIFEAIEEVKKSWHLNQPGVVILSIERR